MKRPVHKAPICKGCGEPLRRHIPRTTAPRGEPAPTEFRGRKVLEVVRSKNPTFASRETWHSVWLGDWGGYGDNHFHGLNCGYRYGLRIARATTK